MPIVPLVTHASNFGIQLLNANDRGVEFGENHYDLIRDCRFASDGRFERAGNLAMIGARSRFFASFAPYHRPPTVQAVVMTSVRSEIVSVLKCLKALDSAFLSGAVSAGCVMKSSDGIHLNVNLALYPRAPFSLLWTMAS